MADRRRRGFRVQARNPARRAIGQFVGMATMVPHKRSSARCFGFASRRAPARREGDPARRRRAAGRPRCTGATEFRIAHATGEENDATEAGLRTLMAPDTPCPAALERYDLGQEFSAGVRQPPSRGRFCRSMRLTNPTSPRASKTRRTCSPAISPNGPRPATDSEPIPGRGSTGRLSRFMAYLPPTRQNDRRLAAARGKFATAQGATKLGYGRAFLHSTGSYTRAPPDRSFSCKSRAPDQDFHPRHAVPLGQLRCGAGGGRPARAASARSAGGSDRRLGLLER